MKYSQHYESVTAQKLDHALDVLSALVTDKLNKGWKANQPMLVVRDHNGFNLIQPMLKEVIEDGDIDEGP